MKRNCYETEEEGLANHSDESLLSAARTGEHLPFIELSKRCTPMILRVLVRITKNKEDAEDAMQETLMKAYVHLKTFDGRSSFSTWLTRIAINSALMELRKGRNHPRVPFDIDLENKDASFMQCADLTPNPEYLYCQNERQLRLKEAIRRLPPALRECIEIQQTKDSSVRETADIIGVSIAATKSRLLRARKKIATSLSRQNLPRGVRNGARNFAQDA